MTLCARTATRKRGNLPQTRTSREPISRVCRSQTITWKPARNSFVACARTADRPHKIFFLVSTFHRRQHASKISPVSLLPSVVVSATEPMCQEKVSGDLGSVPTDFDLVTLALAHSFKATGGIPGSFCTLKIARSRPTRVNHYLSPAHVPLSSASSRKEA